MRQIGSFLMLFGAFCVAVGLILLSHSESVLGSWDCLSKLTYGKLMLFGFLPLAMGAILLKRALIQARAPIRH